MRVAQITDTHITLEVPSRAADLERCVGQINNLHPLPDLVIHTGDVSHNGLPEEYAVARTLLQQLKVPWFVLTGNKDNRDALIEAFPHCGSRRAGFPFAQYAVENFEVRIVCLDTLSEKSNKGDFCLDRLDNLKHMLDAEPERPTAIFMHHPTFEVSTIPDPFQFVSRQNAEALSETIAQHGNVMSVFCGHVHRPYMATIGSVPVQVMTAVALDLRKGKQEPITEKTPLYLLHELDGRSVVDRSGEAGSAHLR